MTNTKPVESASQSATGRPYLWLALLFLALKIPLVIVAVANPEGLGQTVPKTDIGVGLYLTLGFLASSIIFAALRWWVGAVSAVTYSGYSLIGGIILARDFHLWGATITLTSAGALIFLVLSIRQQDFSSRANPDESERD